MLDSVFDGLSDEVVNLKEIRKMLKDKIVKAKGTSNLLEAQINNIDRDLQNKQHSLSVGKSIVNDNCCKRCFIFFENIIIPKCF